jgi:DNA-binding response OmpR family regulator
MSRVLVVEDEAHLAQGLRFNLQAEGHAVEVAGDGETALERLVEKRERFDAVVLDVMLPGKSGFDVAALLREKKNYVPILMLTARGRPEDVLQGFAAGADDYLPKPFELAILMARLESLLRRSVWMKDAAAASAGDDGQAMTRRGSAVGRAEGGRRYLQFLRKDHRLRRTGTAHAGKYHPSDRDGSGVSALSGAQRRPCGFAQVDSRRCVGIARRYRYARHR